MYSLATSHPASISQDGSDNFRSGISRKLPKIATSKVIFSQTADRIAVKFCMTIKKIKPNNIFQNCVHSCSTLKLNVGNWVLGTVYVCGDWARLLITAQLYIKTCKRCERLDRWRDIGEKLTFSPFIPHGQGLRFIKHDHMTYPFQPFCHCFDFMIYRQTSQYCC